MFARIVELFPKQEKREELLKTIRIDVLPILKKQPGFLEILPFLPEIENQKILVVALWAENRDLERYERAVFPKVSGIVRPYLLSPITSRHYKLETSICPHFMETLTA
jgi:quinol monooxygenase YgiN